MDEQKQCVSRSGSPKTFKMQYRGSIFWLIFWLVVFFPVAFVLLLTDTYVDIKGVRTHLKYDGSRFWLGFWVIVFFPIAFLLLFLNGFSMNQCDCDGK